MTPAEFREDLRAGLALARSRGRRRGLSRVYRAAEWSIREAGRRGAVRARRGGISLRRLDDAGPAARQRRRIRRGPHRIERDGWSLVELPPLTGRAFGRRLPMGGAWPFRMFSPPRGWPTPRTRFRDARLPRPSSRSIPGSSTRTHPPMEGLPAMLRAVHFSGLRGFPERFERWLDAGSLRRARATCCRSSFPHDRRRRRSSSRDSSPSGSAWAAISTTRTRRPGRSSRETSERCGRDLARILFEGPDEALHENLAAQAGVYLVSTLVRARSRDAPESSPRATAGYSLGNYAAHGRRGGHLVRGGARRARRGVARDRAAGNPRRDGRRRRRAAGGRGGGARAAARGRQAGLDRERQRLDPVRPDRAPPTPSPRRSTGCAPARCRSCL